MNKCKETAKFTMFEIYPILGKELYLNHKLKPLELLDESVTRCSRHTPCTARIASSTVLHERLLRCVRYMISTVDQRDN